MDFAMNCEKTKFLLCDFQDERLDAGTAWQIQNHLAECSACAEVSRTMQEVSGLLRALPTRKTSAQFDAKLAERIALVRRPDPRPSWPARLRHLLPSPSLLRPILGLGAAAGIAGVAFFATPTGVVPPPLAATAASDGSLVSHCLQQHQSDVAAQPLSDWAAQDLAGHLDSADNAAPAAPEAAPLSAEDIGDL